MDIEFYRLTERDSERVSELFSEDLLCRMGRAGYYTLGAFSEEKELLGALMFYIGMQKDSVCYGKICHIQVDEIYRREGVGTALMDELFRILDSSGVRQCYLLMPENAEDNSDAKAFFEAVGFDFSGEKVREYRGKLGDMVRDDFIKEKPQTQVSTIATLDPEDFTELLSDLAAEAAETEKEFAISAELSRDIDDYDADLSTFYSTEEGEGLLLVRNIGDKVVERAFLGTRGKNASDAVFDLALLAVKNAQLMLDPDTEVIIGDITPTTGMIIDEYARGVKPVTFEKGIKLI